MRTMIIDTIAKSFLYSNLLIQILFCLILEQKNRKWNIG